MESFYLPWNKEDKKKWNEMEHKRTEMRIRIEFCSIAQNPKTSDEEKFQMLSVFFEKNKKNQCFTALFSLTKATTEGDTNA